jgi:surface-anchored protein
VVSAAQTTRLPGSQWDFIGVGSGANYWRLPKDQNISVLFLGLSTEELNASDFVSPITFTLLGVTGTSGSPAPGFFSVWNTGDLGPVPLMSTAVGTTPNSLSVAAGSHSHFNYGFTAPGLYNVEFKVSSTLSPSLGGELVEGTTTYSFGVFDQNNYPEVAATPYVFAGQSFPYFMYGNAHADLGVALVPEPSSVVLAGVGCCGVAAAALRRRQRRVAGENQA